MSLPLRSTAVATPTMEIPIHPATPPSKPPFAHLLDHVVVLVVDDDDDSRVLVESALGSAGAVVHTAASAADALAKLVAAPVDVLVSDIGMPDVDGYTFLETVRAHGGALASLPAVALTAYASDRDIARAERAGFQRHLAKPADVASIVRVVASVAHAGAKR